MKHVKYYRPCAILFAAIAYPLAIYGLVGCGLAAAMLSGFCVGHLHGWYRHNYVTLLAERSELEDKLRQHDLL